LHLNADIEPVDSAKTYLMAGVYSFGRGLFARNPLDGTDTTYKYFHRLHKDDFVISQPKAWEGALARVPQEFDNWFLSPVFPTFRAKQDKLEIRYLEWYCRQSKIWEVLRLKARGIGARRESVLPKQFLSLYIPLPPLSEQRRIVAKIEQLAAKIEEARGLRKQGEEELEAMLASVSDAAFTPQPGWIATFVGDFCEPPQYGFTASAISEPIGPRLLRITDIQEGRVDWDTVPYCQCSNPDQYRLRANDIVFARTGATTGKSFLIRNCPEAVSASYLIRLRVNRLGAVTK